MLAYVLSEYEHYCEMSIMYKKNELNKKDSKFWNEYGSKTKRALKYLAEKIVSKLPNEVEKHVDHHKALSHCWIAAEEMVSLYMSSQVGYSLFPHDCLLIISESSDYGFIEFKCDKLEAAFNGLRLTDFSNNKELGFVPPFNANVQNDYFAEVFKKHFNIDYSGCLYLIQTLIGYFKVTPSDKLKYCFFDKNKMVEDLASDYSNHGLTEEQVSRLLAGFSLSKDKLENRLLYKPKQEYRASRRAFFEVKDGDKEIILFSKSMALEEFSQIIRSLSFRKLPNEWKQLDEQMNKSLARFSNFTGSWFEEYLMVKLREKGLKCERSLKKLNIDGKNYHIPESVGDIDIIVQVENSLHIIECKMVQFASEPVGYIDDFDKFVSEGKSYRNKFNNKVSWVESNIDIVKEHLIGKGFDFSSDPEIKPFMVTFYPTIVSEFIDEFSCLDINQYLRILL